MNMLRHFQTLLTAPPPDPESISQHPPLNPLPIACEAGSTLDGVFRERVRRSPDLVAHLQFDPVDGRWHEFTWADCARDVARWQQALGTLALVPGDRVALLLRNCREWVILDQAALGLGLVTVPLYTSDRAASIDYILQDSGARVLLIEGVDSWQALQPIRSTLDRLQAIIALRTPGGPEAPNLHPVTAWLPREAGELARDFTRPETLASIVYTSGTTGRPKGVMLSHQNFLFNVQAGLQAVAASSTDRMLSFLPLSHALERTVGYYSAVVAGICVAYARSIPQLAEDLLTTRPTILIAVPRVFERVQARIQEQLETASPVRQQLFTAALHLGWEAFLHAQGRRAWSPSLLFHPALDRLVGGKIRRRLGGRLRFAISGGAPLPEEVGRFFLSLGIPILQGYGLTETSPVIAVNRIEDNEPTTVGPALPGIEVRVGNRNELLTRSPSVTPGYWNNEAATRELVGRNGWLHTGDQARIGPRGHITITGRLKDILVLSNGEKVSPAAVEQALSRSPLVEQILVIGDGRPYITALVVLPEGALAQLARDVKPDSDSTHPPNDAHALRRTPAVAERVLASLAPLLDSFPGYVQLRAVALMDEPWTVENGLLTPTLKLRRGAIVSRYRDRVEALYEGH